MKLYRDVFVYCLLFIQFGIIAGITAIDKDLDEKVVIALRVLMMDGAWRGMQFFVGLALIYLALAKLLPWVTKRIIGQEKANVGAIEPSQ